MTHVTGSRGVEGLVEEAFGAGARIGRRSRFPYATSHSMEEVTVVTRTSTVEVLVKNLGSLVDEARMVVPEFLADPHRERDVYRLLAGKGLGTARLYAAENRRLVLEKVRGVPLWEVGDLPVWYAAARWLARFHDARLHEGNPEDAARLLRYDRRHYLSWLVRLQANLSSAEPSLRRALDRLTALFPPLVEELLALPTTMVHGEFYASNVVVARERDGVRICPIDWEMAAIGPGTVDLAALTAGWDVATSARLLRRYRDAASTGRTWTDGEWDRAVDLCRIYLCARWLGWASNWTPPPEHAHDWLGEALAAADRLGF